MTYQNLILGASGYFGERLYLRLGPHLANGTFNTNSFQGGTHFDALKDNINQLLDKIGSIKFAFVMFAEAKIDVCARDFDEARKLNVDATINILHDLISRNIKPVFISTDTVFDGQKGNRTEKDKINPILTYARFKSEVEDYLQRKNKPYVVARVAKLIDCHISRKSLLSEWFRDIQQGKKIYCANDQTLSIIDIDDAVEALILLANSEHPGVYHVGGPEQLTRLELFQIFAEEMRYINPSFVATCEECSINSFDDFLETRPLNTTLNSQKLIDETGFKPRNIRDTCRLFARNIYSQ